MALLLTLILETKVKRHLKVKGLMVQLCCVPIHNSLINS
jgi:hypothetical protein